MNRTNAVNRAALTLLELLIVITILIALSGIVVATLPGLLDQTQTATAGANVSEIDASIKRHAMMNNGVIGNRFDSLLASQGASSTGLPSYLGGTTVFQSISLNENDIVALTSLGITELIPATDQVENATFHSHRNQPVPLSDGSTVCSIVPEQAQVIVERIWNIRPEDQKTYLVFGLGEKSTLVGAGSNAIFAESPVHFSDDPVTNPKTMYSRYLIVVELDRSSQQKSTARYIGTAIPHIDGLQGIGDQIEQFYSK